MRIFSCFCLSIALASAPPTPKVPFTITVSVGTPTVAAGTEVCIKVSITNSSGRDLDDSGGFTYDGIDPNLQFDIRDVHGKMVPKKRVQHPELMAGEAVNRTISPGQIFTQEQCISRIYDFSKPGKYVIQASRRASDNPKDGEIKSNTVILTVVP